MLQGLEAGGRGDVPSTVTAVEVQQHVVALLDVPRQPQHRLRVLRRGSRLVDFVEQAGSVFDKGDDAFLVEVTQFLGLMSTSFESKPTITTRGPRGRRTDSRREGRAEERSFKNSEFWSFGQ